MQKLKSALLYMDYMLCAVIVVSQTFGFNGIVSAAFYATFIISFTLWFCTMAERVDAVDVLAFVTMLLAAVSVGINGMIEHCYFTFEYVKKLIIFCCTLAFFSGARKMVASRAFFETVRILFLIIGLVFAVMYATRRRQMQSIAGSYSAYLTFRFTNPNLTALFLCGMIMFLMISVVKAKKVSLIDIVTITVVGVEFVFIFQTRTRNVILPMLLFILTYFWCVLLGKKIRIRKWMLAVVILLPLAAVFVYLAVVNSSFVARMFSFLIAEGKGIDARVVVWNQAIRNYYSSPLIGTYFSAGNGKGYFQMHNSHLDVLVSYGFIVFVLLCVYLFILLSEQTAAPVDRKRLPAVAFICMLLNGIGEAALFSGGLGIYLLAGIFLIREAEGKSAANDGERLRSLPAHTA